MTSLAFTLNGKAVELDVDPSTPLLWVIRDELAMTGTKFGCGMGLCGACTVHLNGNPIRSCSFPVQGAVGQAITTIEGLAVDGKLHPMQQAFHENHGLQCGFCTPGMIMSAIELVRKNPAANEKQIREGLEGNLCRCTGYHNIVKSIQAAAKTMRE